MLPEINEKYTNFVLEYAKTEGLDSLVRKINLNDEKNSIVVDLQPDLISSFSIEFPEANLKELDSVIEWILITAVAKRKDELSKEK